MDSLVHARARVCVVRPWNSESNRNGFSFIPPSATFVLLQSDIISPLRPPPSSLSSYFQTLPNSPVPVAPSVCLNINNSW